MDKIFLLIMVLLVSSVTASAQTASASATASALAAKIADKMRDSLGLSPEQREGLYNINMQLSSQKGVVRSQFTNRDSVMAGLQRVEGSRDSLYKGVLTENQYQQYKQKKRALVSAN